LHQANGKNKKGEIVTYEALAFDSVGIIMYARPSFDRFTWLIRQFSESLSDNLNRTIANLREIFNDHEFVSCVPHNPTSFTQVFNV
jgi:hypothetical protein